MRPRLAKPEYQLAEVLDALRERASLKPILEVVMNRDDAHRHQMWIRPSVNRLMTKG